MFSHHPLSHRSLISTMNPPSIAPPSHPLSWIRNALKRPHNEIDNDATSSSSSSRTNGSGSNNKTPITTENSNSTGIDEMSTKKKRVVKVATTSNHIFTRISFSELPLDSRLATHLEKSILDGGMGLLSSTRIQRSVYDVHGRFELQNIHLNFDLLIQLMYYVYITSINQSPATN